MLFSLFLLTVLAVSPEPWIGDVFFILLILPIIILLIRRVVFLYDKQYEVFPEERQRIVASITRALERDGINTKIINHEIRFPRWALYNTHIIIDEDTYDIRLYLEGRRLVSTSKTGVKEINTTLVYIGPISPPKMAYIERIQSIIDKELL